MCLYPRFFQNRRYDPTTQKNTDRGFTPPVTDTRTLYVPVPCGNCIECRKKKAREWQIRLQEDIKTHTGAKFITLTFSNEGLAKVHTDLMQDPTNWGLKGFELDNAIATRAMRRFNERYRSKYKKAVRHWMVTELGHEGTNNIHMHGIIWPGSRIKKGKVEHCTMDEIEKLWNYGFVWKYKLVKSEKVNYVNNRTVNYIVKYVSKRDEMYQHYKSIVLCSPGIGHNYTTTPQATKNKFKPTETNQTYRTESGHKISLPSYWRKKIYTDDEREELWLQSLDRKTAYVCGEQVSTKNGNQELFKLRDYYRKKNRRLGYGSYHKDEDRLQWEENRRAEKFMIRIINAERKTTPSAGS